jgi:hypothetical protein
MKFICQKTRFDELYKFGKEVIGFKTVSDLLEVKNYFWDKKYLLKFK